MHILISPIFVYKLCPVATPKHPEPFLLEIYVRVAAIAPYLQRVPFYSVIKVLHHGSTIKLLSFLILIK
jgi:hypothetical protein